MIKIGIDIDDVVCNTIPIVVEFYNKKYNKNLKFEDIKSFNLWEIGIGRNKEEVTNIVDTFDLEVGYENLELLPYVYESIIELSKHGDLFFITSRSDKFKIKTLKYFQNHFSNIPFDIIFSNDFHNNKGSMKKSDYCCDLGIQFFIDDNPDYLFDCAKEGVNCFLVSKPWNRDVLENKNITRVEDFSEVVNKIKFLEVKE